MASRFLLGAASLLLCAPLLSAQLRVPQDFATIQDAIDGAVTGEVILVTGGEHGPFVIDKPLTIIGSDSARPLLRPYNTMEFQSLPAPSYDPPVTLAGTGSGTVTLAGLDIGGELWWEYQTSAPAIGGGGFDELRVLHCNVKAPTWPTLGNPFSSAAVDVDVAQLLVRDSVVVGGKAGFNGGWISFDVPVGGAGIRSTGDVQLFDSAVRGGEGFDVTFFDPTSSGPASCDQLSNGDGGVGIVTPGTLHVATSLIEGGPGADVHVDDDVTVNFLCTRPDGELIDVGQSVSMDDDLTGSGPLVPDTHWTLHSISPSATGGLLMISAQPIPPVASAAGLLYMQPGQFTLAPIGLSAVDVTFAIRDEPALYGATVVVQRYDFAQGSLSRPVHATLVGP